ncbi:MAG: twitching motility protein PilT [Sporichthyaceae bacterium]
MNVPLYDTGALIAAEALDKLFWQRHLVAVDRDLQPIVPATAMAQAVRGPRQTNLNRLLEPCLITRLDSAGAREIGALLAASGTSDIVDADVVRIAIATNATIFTSDRADLEHIAASVGAHLTIVDV